MFLGLNFVRPHAPTKTKIKHEVTWFWKEKKVFYRNNIYTTTFWQLLKQPSLILTCVFILSLLISLSIVFDQSQEKKSGCHQSCLILVVQISLLFVHIYSYLTTKVKLQKSKLRIKQCRKHKGNKYDHSVNMLDCVGIQHSCSWKFKI